MTHLLRANFRTVTVLTGLVLFGVQLWADESPWYVAARLGDAAVDARLGSRGWRIDDENTATAVEVGYTINRHLAVEVGYQDLGRHAGFVSACPPGADVCIQRLASLGLCVEGFDCTQVFESLEAEVDGVSLALLPIWPISERFSLRGKAGLIAWDADVSVERGAITTSASRLTPNGELFSSRDLLAGVGAHYSFPSGLGLLLMHETFDLEARTTSLGVSWRF